MSFNFIRQLYLTSSAEGSSVFDSLKGKIIFYNNLHIRNIGSTIHLWDTDQPTFWFIDLNNVLLCEINVRFLFGWGKFICIPLVLNSIVCKCSSIYLVAFLSLKISSESSSSFIKLLTTKSYSDTITSFTRSLNLAKKGYF